MGDDLNEEELLGALFPAEVDSPLTRLRHELRALYEPEPDKTTKELLYMAYTIVDFVDSCKGEGVARKLTKFKALRNALNSFRRVLRLDYLHNK
jgi:hypothetical protein